MYICTQYHLTNAFVDVSIIADVNVTSIAPRAMSYCPNSDLTVNCTADGNPAPQIRWTRGITNIVNSSTLTLMSESLQDGAVYTCTATSGLASDTDTITINSKQDRALYLAACLY